MTTNTLADRTRTRAEYGEFGFLKALQPARPMSDRSRASNREWYPGLCTTCTSEPVCTFPRSADRPVTSCDEFQGVVEVKSSPLVVRPRDDERFAIANREWFPGLCVACEKREACTFPAPEGGVFNCEEFK